jgi:hypothetical protein
MRLTLLLLAASLCAQAQTLTLSGPFGPPVSVGAPVPVLVTLAGTNGGAAAVQWFLPAVTGISAVMSSTLNALGKSLLCQLNGIGDYRCILSGGLTLIPDGPLATITVPMPMAATPLTLTGTWAVDATADSPGIAITPGPVFTLTPRSPCDINGDGKVDDKDIRHVQDEIDGVIVPATTDLDGNGKTDVVDLQRVIDAAATNGTCRVGA